MSIKSGSDAAFVMSRLNKSKVHGVGINDADYIVRPKGSVCKFYSVWSSMIDRCYNKKNARYKTYSRCSVCDEWLTFSKFKAWMESQDWEGNFLDKDLISPGNKVYHPDFCAFVSREANNLILHKKRPVNTLPTGVNLVRGRYRAEIRQNGKSRIIGYYTSAKDAFVGYAKEKSYIMNEVASRQADERVSRGIVSHANKLLAEAANYSET